MASPSLSSSDANQTVSASLAYFFNSATNFFFHLAPHTWAKSIFDINGGIAGRQITDVTHARFYNKALPEILLDGFGFGR